MNTKKTLAEQAIALPIFSAFRFCWVNYASLKELPSGNLCVSFSDGSHFIMNKNGEMLLTFLVCGESAYSQLPSIWVSAKNKNDAICLYKKDVETYMGLKAILPF